MHKCNHLISNSPIYKSSPGKKKKVLSAREKAMQFAKSIKKPKKNKIINHDSPEYPVDEIENWIQHRAKLDLRVENEKIKMLYFG